MKYRLKEIFEEFHSGDSIKAEEFCDSGKYPVYGGNGIRGNVNRYNAEGNYLIIGRQGAYCGNVRYQSGPSFLTEHAILAKPNEGFNYIYLSYYLNRLGLYQFQGQSAQPGLSVNTISNIEVDLPCCAVQAQIGNCLEEIDRKISLNRRINSTLEAMAKQLYDYWFVQFDFPNEEGKPYKSSGGKMVWNEKLKREIPEGWEVKSVNELCTSYRGVSYDKSDLLSDNNGILVLRGNNIQNSALVYDNNVAYIPQHLVSEEQKIKRNDIVMTMPSGSKEHIGKCMLFKHDSKDTYGAFLTKFTNMDIPNIMFLFFISDYCKAKIKVICNGTGINNLTNQTIDEILLALPTNELCNKFENIVEPYLSKRGANEQENLHLTSLRDFLLPLLMNGQVTINDV